MAFHTIYGGRLCRSQLRTQVSPPLFGNGEVLKKSTGEIVRLDPDWHTLKIYQSFDVTLAWGQSPNCNYGWVAKQTCTLDYIPAFGQVAEKFAKAGFAGSLPPDHPNNPTYGYSGHGWGLARTSQGNWKVALNFVSVDAGGHGDATFYFSQLTPSGDTFYGAGVYYYYDRTISPEVHAGIGAVINQIGTIYVGIT